MIDICTATPSDIDDLIQLQVALFHEDAGVYEQHVDLTWPVREGRNDFDRLLADERCLVLIARDEERPIGFLVAYLTMGSGSRHPVTYAHLRSLYVEPAARVSGVASALTEQFLLWSRAKECAQAVVDCYAENQRAQRFYERIGFTSLSVSKVLDL